MKLNFIEQVISVISPSAGMRRAMEREMLVEYQEMRKYSGAARSPLTKDWFALSTSARAEVNADRITLRNRMRELVRNDGWAYTAMQALANNVVGKGIQPTISGPDGLREKVEKLVMDFCTSTDADYYGNLNFFGLQHLAVSSMSQSGNVLCLKRYVGEGRNMQLKLQFLEDDFLVQWYSIENPSGFPAGTYVENGIYFDRNGIVLGYELYTQHPGDSSQYGNTLEHFFASADDCILLNRTDRAGQHMGVPTGTSVMLDLKMLGQYELAQAHKQTVSAMFAMFITTVNPAGPLPGGTASKKWPQVQNLTPGTIVYTNPGETVESSQPPSVDGFDEYTKNKLRKIAKGFGLSYAVLSGDMNGASFSSERMGWIEMQRNIESIQDHVVIAKLCRRVAKWLLDLERLKGTIPVDIKDIRVDWTPPRREMLDPVKETEALNLQVQSGFKTLPDAIRSLGDDPSRVFKEIGKTYEILDKLKLVLISDYRKVHEEKKKPANEPEKPEPKK